jgi:hypothetical protein
MQISRERSGNSRIQPIQPRGCGPLRGRSRSNPEGAVNRNDSPALLSDPQKLWAADRKIPIQSRGSGQSKQHPPERLQKLWAPDRKIPIQSRGSGQSKQHPPERLQKLWAPDRKLPIQSCLHNDGTTRSATVGSRPCGRRDPQNNPNMKPKIMTGRPGNL